MDLFTADPHLDHGNIMKYCRRTKFMDDNEKKLMQMAEEGTISQDKIRLSQESVDRMNDAIIDAYNQKAQKNDKLWVVGDMFWGHDINRIRSLRDRINCGNIILVKGNHDPDWFYRPPARSMFADVIEQTLVKVEGQLIFFNHYPMRSWDKAHNGAWNLYGHVHGLFWDQDTKGMSDKFKNTIIEEYKAILVESGLPEDDNTEALAQRLIEPWLLREGVNLTLDIGVDTNDYQPWTFYEIQKMMAPRMKRWLLRKEGKLGYISRFIKNVSPSQ